jgi:hypothetical protein
MRYKDQWGKYFISTNDLKLYFISCKSHREPNRAYHAEVVCLTDGKHYEVKATDEIPSHWSQVDIQIVPKEGE